MSGTSFSMRLSATRTEALTEFEETVLAWGGDVLPREDEAMSTRVSLPVRAGLRYGWVSGEARLTPVTDTSAEFDVTRLDFTIDDEVYRVDKAAFAVLLLAAAGCLVTIVAPLVPRLISLVPVGILLAVGAWLFIVARLRNSGPEEFFEQFEDILGHVPQDDENDDDASRDRLRER